MGAQLRWLPFELHPETPPEGAPKPFGPAEWPKVRARLVELAARVGLPIDPPERNFNSRAALEIGELVRERAGDDAAGRYHHAVSRAFFTEHANISDLALLARQAAAQGIAADEVEAAWRERRYRDAVDEAGRTALRAGVRGVPAFAWNSGPAVAGMREPESLVQILMQLRQQTRGLDSSGPAW